MQVYVYTLSFGSLCAHRSVNPRGNASAYTPAKPETVATPDPAVRPTGGLQGTRRRSGTGGPAVAWVGRVRRPCPNRGHAHRADKPRVAVEEVRGADRRHRSALACAMGPGQARWSARAEAVVLGRRGLRPSHPDTRPLRKSTRATSRVAVEEVRGAD